MHETIRYLEEVSMNAWPALQTILDDGWVLRLANGYTKRANSVNPLYPCRRDLGDKLELCETFYRERDQKVVFKMTQAATPEGLDDALAARGYRVDSPTSVQVLQLDNGLPAPERTADLAGGLSPLWLDEYVRLSGVDPTHRPTIFRMLDSMVLDRCLALLRVGDQAVSCGLAILQGKHIGLFDIVTDASCRQRGYGRQMMLNLLDWGKRRGAQEAYLQVMLNNPLALRLYDALGFHEVYQYWYRIK